eukprot:7379639-Prymnesium_polylepis.2
MSAAGVSVDRGGLRTKALRTMYRDRFSESNALCNLLTGSRSVEMKHRAPLAYRLVILTR